MNSRARARSGFSTNCAMGATGAAARGAANIAVTGFGGARHDAEGHQLAGRGGRIASRIEAWKAARSAARDPPAAPASARRRPRAGAPHAPPARWPAPCCAPPALTRCRRAACPSRAVARRPGTGAPRCTRQWAWWRPETPRAAPRCPGSWCARPSAPGAAWEAARATTARGACPRRRRGSPGPVSWARIVPQASASGGSQALAAPDRVVLEALLLHRRRVVQDCGRRRSPAPSTSFSGSRSPGCGIPSTP